jgi:hypothetical protein
LEEDNFEVDPLDPNSGTSESKHGSFEGLPTFSSDASALDDQDKFYDAIQNAPDAHLTNDEANQYLKSILKIDMDPTEKSTIRNR